MVVLPEPCDRPIRDFAQRLHVSSRTIPRRLESRIPISPIFFTRRTFPEKTSGPETLSRTSTDPTFSSSDEVSGA